MKYYGNKRMKSLTKRRKSNVKKCKSYVNQLEMILIYSKLHEIMRAKFYIFLGFGLCIWLFSAVSFINKNEVLPEKQLTVALRDVGHQLLWHAHDSTSRVLPINKTTENTYQIRFESNFTFVPDTLISIVDKRFKKSFPTMPDYIVNVLGCEKNEIVLAYEISLKSGNTLPCIGRTQPKGCYVIEISFLEKPSSNWQIYILSLLPILLIGFLIIDRIPKKKTTQPLISEPHIEIGKLKFYFEKKLLEDNLGIVIELSDKENKILKIFAKNQNQIIERERLMKEVWEDEGVIVISRNLDVFVSKLRKKLQSDENIKIVNIHAKGYKLEVN